MLITARWFLIFCLFFSSTALAHNKVVVVPLIGDGSSHEHPDMEYVSISAAAFQPKLSSSFYSHSDDLLSTNAGPTDHILFVTNLSVPNGVTIKTVTATYRDGNTARDVEVRVKGVAYSDISSAVFAEIRSTGVSFTQFTSRSAPFVLFGGIPRFNPVDNRNNAYFVEVGLRNGAALRGVKISYTTGFE